jgi:hypothetical protein
MSRGLATVAVALVLLPLVACCSPKSSGAASPSPSGPAQVPPGTHSTVSFQPATSYTVGDGWLNPIDSSDYFNLALALDQNNGIHLFHNPQALSQDAACPAAPQAGVGTSAAELLAWIRSLKGLNVSQPVMVTVAGLPATQVDVSIHANWSQSCSFANGLPTVPLFYRASVALGWWVAGDEKLRLDLVDVPGQGTVVVDLDSFAGDGFGDLLASGSPVVKSLSFPAK